MYKRNVGKLFNNDKIISKLLIGSEELRRAQVFLTRDPVTEKQVVNNN